MVDRRYILVSYPTVQRSHHVSLCDDKKRSTATIFRHLLQYSTFLIRRLICYVQGVSPTMLSHRGQMLALIWMSAAYQFYHSVVVSTITDALHVAPIEWNGVSLDDYDPRMRFRPYYEFAAQIDNLTATVRHNSETSFSRASVKSKKRRSWFQPTKQCSKTCCVKTVAISMDHEESSQLLNTVDGLDLADIMFRAIPGPEHLKFHANDFHEDLIPCLQPGTIIHLNNQNKILRYFWRKIRPRIKVPFILVTSDSDSNSPRETYVSRLEEDPLLIRWYGQNPHVPKKGGGDVEVSPKFRPMPLGLSMYHPQSKYLTPYLALTNYTNPFMDMSRFTNGPFDWDRDVMVFFARRRDHRKKLWSELCGGSNNFTNSTSLSCSDRSVSPSQIYTEASSFKFGISPPGRGWDCYRTYEWLYLGIIPIIEERAPYSYLLFEGLPVIHFPNLSKPDTTKEDLVQAIQEYINDPDFGSVSSTQGWNRLFLAYWRRKILQDANRTTIFNKDGREYYIGYRYETIETREPVFCSEPGKCVA